MIQEQCGAVAGEDDVVVLPSYYQMDIRIEKKETGATRTSLRTRAKGAEIVKEEASSEKRAQPVLSYVPQGHSSQRVVNKALYQITSVLHQLAGIVQDVHQANQSAPDERISGEGRTGWWALSVMCCWSESVQARKGVTCTQGRLEDIFGEDLLKLEDSESSKAKARASRRPFSIYRLGLTRGKG
ncbi:unnamed protein product [Arabis nemorensis]|uniref:Uncharacterized protein n=1 Tax=Arabis nemorensis TaxID=586526 RepID=A0A565C4K8_9BRAS|nr:unnamed protein product [Arabis nemorensis]